MKYWQISLAIIAALSASIAFADDFKTISGKEYKNANVSHVEFDGIVVRTESGISKIYWWELPKEVQQRFRYDTDKTETAARAAKEKRVAESHNAVAVNPTAGQSETGPHNAVAVNPTAGQSETGPLVILAALVLLVVGGISVVIYANAKSRAARKARDEKLTISNEKGEWAEIPKLMPCPDCRKEVSVNAASCPHCGRKLKQEQTAIGLLAAIIIGLLIAGGLGLCSR